MRNTGTSSACSNWPYANLPDPSGGSTRIDRAYLGSRVLGYSTGTLTNCDTITGTVAGSVNGFPELDGRVRGCHLATGADCGTATWQALDTQASQSNQTIVGSQFSMIRVANNVTCADVRAMTFP
jgi:hypothetical protein